MIKDVLISIRPEWVDQIIAGKKIFEIRKSAPKIQNMPCKVYIYCTYGDMKTNYALGKRGFVVGEFTLRKVETVKKIAIGNAEMEYVNISQDRDTDWRRHCGSITTTEIEKYGNGKTLYLWSIQDLKIYNMPLNLAEFGSNEMIYDDNAKEYKPCFVAIGNPPQSWCYVERRKCSE